MMAQPRELWNLVDERWIHPEELAEAIEEQLAEEPLDYRTRLLIRDSAEALRWHWGTQCWSTWLAQCPHREKLETICREEFERAGFPFLQEQLMEPTKPEAIRAFLRDIGSRLPRPVQVAIGRSGSTILQGYLERKTQDVDIVDEVPKEIRELGPTLRQLEKLHLLQIAHFQSHYLPSGWFNRLHSLAPIGNLRVQLVDVYDIFLSKLSSIREKDRQDLLDLKPKLDKAILVHRLQDSMVSVLASSELRQRCEQNWYVFYGEPLPA